MASGSELKHKRRTAVSVVPWNSTFSSIGQSGPELSRVWRAIASVCALVAPARFLQNDVVQLTGTFGSASQAKATRTPAPIDQRLR